MKPFLRWAGSKRQLLSRLKPYWPGGSTRYVEPFCGSSCLFFDVEPRRALLGDLNSELVRTLRAVRLDVTLVLECLRRLRRGSASYYKVRRQDPRELPDPEAAARFIYLNHYCFNGLYRTNSKGEFNVPYGASKNGSPVDTSVVLKASKVLRDATIVCQDFEETVAGARSGDFVYLDPPYVVSSRRIFAEYLPGTFGLADLARLGTCLRSMDKRGVLFVVSYADSPEARKLLAPWKPVRVRVRRHIAGFSASRRSAYEVIASNIAVRGR